MSKKRNENNEINKIVQFNKEIKECKGARKWMIKDILSDENVENICHKLDNYYDDFLKIEVYKKSKNELSKISDKIDNIQNEEIRKLFIEYQHSLQRSNEYEVCLSHILGLYDGILISAIK